MLALGNGDRDPHVAHSRAPLLPDPAFVMAAVHVEQTHQQLDQAPALLGAAADRVRQQQPPAGGTVTGTKVLEGPPIDTIVAEAASWGADLIVLGSHGHTPVTQALLGSVASGVAAHAGCAVEIVRRGRRPVTARTA